AHREFDAVALQHPPAFHLRPVGGLRPEIEPFSRLIPRRLPLEAEGLAHEMPLAAKGLFAAAALDLAPQAFKGRSRNARHAGFLQGGSGACIRSRVKRLAALSIKEDRPAPALLRVLRRALISPPRLQKRAKLTTVAEMRFGGAAASG